ncbi:S9 family peptidase [Alteromonas gilva]|uniref:S9 family peptidase n=1 Tax=Alteromonas gilva TaxID=2987522 RepID=A0ABT5L4Q4_9ALTE|nr:S9 family peptidase [Alteromonas gilva]MDC8832025.1 S9 family peptidase [Alteromonas gilva]
MNKTLLLPLSIAIAMLAACSDDKMTQQQQPEPETPLNLSTSVAAPVAKKVAYELTAHGETRVDNYYWMRDDSRTDEAVLSHLEKENSYAEKVLAPLESQQEALYEEMTARIPKDDSSVPVKQNDYWYVTHYQGDGEYPIYVRKPSLDGEETVLLDGNKMAEGESYFNIGSYAASPDNTLLAYTVDTVSRRLYTLRVKNIESGEILSDTLTDTNGQVYWGKDNTTLYYIKRDKQTLLGSQVYRHTLGTDQADDELVYEQTDPTFYTSLGKSKDGKVIYIYHDNTEQTGVTLIDNSSNDATPVPFYPLEDGHEYSVAKRGNEYFILTNWQADNYRIMKVDAGNTQDRSKWQEVVAHDPDIYIASMELLSDYVVYKAKENGYLRLEALSLKDGEQRTIPTEDPIYTASFTGNTQPDTNTVRIYYASLTTPPSFFDINLETLQSELKKQTKVGDDFDSDNYQSERLMITARDGKQVPVSLVYRKSLFTKDGSNPLFQYGYGSYGSTIDPTFSTSWLSMLDRGFVVAIAHVRGSKMLGTQWYEDGKMGNKKNTFTDFIDVTKGLIEQGYADPARIFAEGGSAGGLLMGAIANMAPELYTAIAAHVPFVDVVTTMSDASIPLTTGEYSEWGNPANKQEYEYILTYSPYDQVKKQDYPHMFVTTGLHDSQVQYFEPMKWVAKLRDYKTDDNLLLFMTDMEAGHGGASGRFKRYEQRAKEYAFFFHLAGIEL